MSLSCEAPKLGSTCGGLVTERHLMNLLTFLLGNLIRRLVVGDCVEESIHERVRITLPRLADVAHIMNSRMQKHFPNCWVAPEVRLSLRENLDSKIIVATLHAL